MKGRSERFRGKRIRLIRKGEWDQYAGRHFLARVIA